MTAAQQRLPVPVSEGTAGILLASRLMRRLEETERPVEAAMRQVLAPVSARLQRHPGRPVRDGTLTDAARAWGDLGGLGRFRFSVALDNPRQPIFHDTRFRPGQYTILGEAKPRYGLLVIMICASPSRDGTTIRTVPYAVITEHALGRRFQRSQAADAADDSVVLDECGVLLWDYLNRHSAKERWSSQVPSGQWLGHTVQTAERRPLLVARTFVERTAVPAWAA